MTGIDRSPTRLGSGIALLAALLAAVASGPYSWIALGTGTVGFALVLVGVVVGERAACTTGSAGLFVGVIAAGARGAPVPIVIGGGVAAVVAWDSAGTAIDLGAQLGRAADTTRLELVHVAGTTTVGCLAAGIAWTVYRVGIGTYSLTVPALLLVAALCIAVALATRTE